MTRDTGLRVLLVEDDPDAARLFERRLEAGTASFRIDHAPDLQSALRLLETGPYDAMVLDLSLPDGPATSTLALAATFSRHVPIVVLTGSDEDDLALTAARIGIQDYLVKARAPSTDLERCLLSAIRRHNWMLRAIAHGA